jgi:hypothetical protein
MIWIFKILCVSTAVVVTFTTGALAQWSIGQEVCQRRRQKCIGLPEQKCIKDGGKRPPSW